MNIPKMVPFDKMALDKLWHRINNYKTTTDTADKAVRRDELSVIFNDYRQAVGLPIRTYHSTTEMFADLQIFIRIAKIKAMGFQHKDRVVVDGVPGTVQGITEDGRLQIIPEYGSARVRNFEPQLVSKAA